MRMIWGSQVRHSAQRAANAQRHARHAVPDRCGRRLLVTKILAITGCNRKSHEQAGTHPLASTASWMDMKGLAFRAFSWVVLPSQHTI